MLEIAKKVGELTKYDGSGDKAAIALAKEAALEAAAEYQKTEKKAMDRLRRKAQQKRDQYGDEAPEYTDVNKEYYKQKARYEQVKKILASTNSASLQAAAEVDKAKWGKALADW
jgi:hypothetical protein